MGFDSFSTAAKMRDTIISITETAVKRMRPDALVGKVLSINNDAYTAEVTFAGDTGFINARFTPSLIPKTTGVIVRVKGRPGDYYISDILNAAAANELYDDLPDRVDQIELGELKFFQDVRTVALVGTQSIYLTYEPILNSEHLYWNGAYQAGAEWSRTGKAFSIPDPSSYIKVGDTLEVEYAYRDRGQPTYQPLGGNAQGFDGSGGQMAGTLENGTLSMSVSLLVRVDSTNYGTVVCSESGSNANTRFLVDITGGQFRLRYRDPNSAYLITAGGNPHDGQAHYLAVTFDNTSRIAILYIDGVFVGSVTIPAGSLSANGQLNVGARYLGGNQMIGVVDEVATWNRALSNSEVAEQYSAWGADYPTTILAQSPYRYYRLDETSGTNVFDTVTQSQGGGSYYGMTANDTPPLQKGS